MSCHVQNIGKIFTKNSSTGLQNGYLLTIANEYTEDLPIEQVYITVCEGRDIKGPHMHHAPKTDRFYCIKGTCAVVCRDESTGEYQEFVLSEFDNQVLIIPPNNSHAIVNLLDQPALVLSMPSEGYQPGLPYNQIETKYDDYDWSKWNTNVFLRE